MKNEKKNIVLLDCIGQDIFKQEFTFEHASNIFKIQHQRSRNDWTLSEGQNLDLNNGILATKPNTDDTSKRRTVRTDQLPEA